MRSRTTPSTRTSCGPGFRFAAGETARAYHEPAAGYVRPELAVAAQLGLAAKIGARLRLAEPVLEWRASPQGARVRTADGVYDADRLVLCAGAWINQLFPQGHAHFAVFRQLLVWFSITGHP